MLPWAEMEMNVISPPDTPSFLSGGSIDLQ